MERSKVDITGKPLQDINPLALHDPTWRQRTDLNLNGTETFTQTREYGYAKVGGIEFWCTAKLPSFEEQLQSSLWKD